MPPVSEDQFSRALDRIAAVEQRQAVREETLKSMDTRLAGIESAMSRITWLIVTAIIASIMAFLLKGGFSGVPPI